MALNPLPHWCAVGKSSLLMGQQWQDAAAAAATALLKAQLEMIDMQQSVLSLHGCMDLYHELAGDLASRQHELAKAVIERAGGCVEALRRAGNKDDMAIVLTGFMQDVGNSVKENAGQTIDLLNSAQAASVVLVHKALDGVIDNAIAPRE